MITFFFDPHTAAVLPLFAVGMFTCPDCESLHLKISVGWLWWWAEITFTFPTLKDKFA